MQGERHKTGPKMQLHLFFWCMDGIKRDEAREEYGTLREKVMELKNLSKIKS